MAAGGVAHSAVVTGMFTPSPPSFCVCVSNFLLFEAKGVLYTFGRGKHGRLGHGDVKDSNPEVVKAFEFKKIVWVSCGWQHTCALDSEGVLYTCKLLVFYNIVESHSLSKGGCGKQGQLGHSNRNDVKAPKMVRQQAVP